MTKVWFKYSSSQHKVGIVTDTYGSYVEVWCEDKKDWFIVHVNDIQIIEKNGKRVSD
jgi:hypothetical protein